jgi:hypothetical protein
MFRRYPVCAALAVCLLAPLVQGAERAAPSRELGEIIGDDVYVNCEYHVAAQFPGEPMFRDITYRDGAKSAPARQFYFERGKDLLSVTIVHFANGPDQDKALVDGAVQALHRRGDVHFDFSVFYDDPGVPGHQLNIGLPDGRQLRASVYMVDHRLYITEAATVDPNDFSGFLFEESVSLIDEHGTDFDSNPVGVASSAVGTSAGLPPRQYDCSRINRKR